MTPGRSRPASPVSTDPRRSVAAAVTTALPSGLKTRCRPTRRPEHVAEAIAFRRPRPRRGATRSSPAVTTSFPSGLKATLVGGSCSPGAESGLTPFAAASQSPCPDARHAVACRHDRLPSRLNARAQDPCPGVHQDGAGCGRRQASGAPPRPRHPWASMPCARSACWTPSGRAVEQLRGAPAAARFLRLRAVALRPRVGFDCHDASPDASEAGTTSPIAPPRTHAIAPLPPRCSASSSRCRSSSAARRCSSYCALHSTTAPAEHVVTDLEPRGSFRRGRSRSSGGSAASRARSRIGSRDLHRHVRVARRDRAPCGRSCAPEGVTSWWNIRAATARSLSLSALIASSRCAADDLLRAAEVFRASPAGARASRGRSPRPTAAT